jgi:hypothetical protein
MDQDGERRALLRVGQGQVHQAVASRGRLDLLARWWLKSESLGRDAMIERDPVGCDPLKRLTVTRRGDLQQDPTVGVDLKRVAVGTGPELIKLKRARALARG